MKLPRWFPAVRRPFNPAYREVWDAMSFEERQESTLIDVFIVAVFILILVASSACQRVPQQDDTTFVDKEDEVQAETGIAVYVDPKTNCQYLGYSSHGLTPRLDADGRPICGPR